MIKKVIYAFRFIKQDEGQAMVEYAIITVMAVAVGLFINRVMIDALNDYYALIANILCLPIP